MIAPWLRPMLWGERDWDRALRRVVHASGGGGDRDERARALGAACEHVAPDRRRAIAAYAAGGPELLARARALAVAEAWWPSPYTGKGLPASELTMSSGMSFSGKWYGP